MSPLIWSFLFAAIFVCSDGTIIGSEAYLSYCKLADNMGRPRSCLDLRCLGKEADGVYRIYPDGNDFYSFEVYCDQTTDGGGWTVFQRRMDGWVDFYRNWQNYKLGFGDVNGEHWLGFDKLSTLIMLSSELRVDLEAFSNEKAYAKFSSFSIGNASTGYTLQVSGYSGNAGDSLVTHDGMKFSTFDRDNDAWIAASCASQHHGAWWYNTCHGANLNGNYYNGVHKSYADGVNWASLKGFYESLKTAEMKFRVQLQ